MPTHLRELNASPMGSSPMGSPSNRRASTSVTNTSLASASSGGGSLASPSLPPLQSPSSGRRRSTVLLTEVSDTYAPQIGQDAKRRESVFSKTPMERQKEKEAKALNKLGNLLEKSNDRERRAQKGNTAEHRRSVVKALGAHTDALNENEDAEVKLTRQGELDLLSVRVEDEGVKILASYQMMTDGGFDQPSGMAAGKSLPALPLGGSPRQSCEDAHGDAQNDEANDVDDDLARKTGWSARGSASQVSTGRDPVLGDTTSSLRTIGGEKNSSLGPDNSPQQQNPLQYNEEEFGEEDEPTESRSRRDSEALNSVLSAMETYKFGEDTELMGHLTGTSSDEGVTKVLMPYASFRSLSFRRAKKVGLPAVTVTATATVAGSAPTEEEEDNKLFVHKAKRRLSIGEKMALIPDTRRHTVSTSLAAARPRSISPKDTSLESTGRNWKRPEKLSLEPAQPTAGSGGAVTPQSRKRAHLANAVEESRRFSMPATIGSREQLDEGVGPIRVSPDTRRRSSVSPLEGRRRSSVSPSTRNDEPSPKSTLDDKIADAQDARFNQELARQKAVEQRAQERQDHRDLRAEALKEQKDELKRLRGAELCARWTSVFLFFRFCSNMQMLKASLLIANVVFPLLRRRVLVRLRREERARLTANRVAEGLEAPGIADLRRIRYIDQLPTPLIRNLPLNLRPVLYAKGECLYHEGDITHELNIIAVGSVEVLKREAATPSLHALDGTTRRRQMKSRTTGPHVSCLNALGPGDVFGELTLLLRLAAPETYRCTSTTVVWKLDKRHFDEALSGLDEAKRSQIHAQAVKDRQAVMAAGAPIKPRRLQEIPCFSHWPIEILSNLIQRSTAFACAAGDVLCRAGDDCSTMYVLMEKGCVTIGNSNDGSAIRVEGVAVLRAVETFFSKRTTDDIVAAVDCTFWCLRREDVLEFCIFNAELALETKQRIVENGVAGWALPAPNQTMPRFSIHGGRPPHDATFVQRAPVLSFLFPQEALVDLWDVLEPVVFSRGDVLSQVGERHRGIYIVTKGEVELRYPVAEASSPVVSDRPTKAPLRKGRSPSVSPSTASRNPSTNNHAMSTPESEPASGTRSKSPSKTPSFTAVLLKVTTNQSAPVGGATAAVAAANQSRSSSPQSENVGSPLKSPVVGGFGPTTVNGFVFSALEIGLNSTTNATEAVATSSGFAWVVPRHEIDNLLSTTRGRTAYSMMGERLKTDTKVHNVFKKLLTSAPKSYGAILNAAVKDGMRPVYQDHLPVLGHGSGEFGVETHSTLQPTVVVDASNVSQVSGQNKPLSPFAGQGRDRRLSTTTKP